MLHNVTICNYILIDECQIEFTPGLCVITGETGAGKSILLGAIQLLIGARATGTLLRNNSKPAILTAEFTGNDTIIKLMLDNGLLAEDSQIIIKRILQPDGKSRCFINDQLVTVNMLKLIGEQLIEFHGQRDQLALQEVSTHREMLDNFADIKTELTKLAQLYNKWQLACKTLQQKQAEILNNQHEKDYLQHVYKELKQLNPQPGEEAELAAQRKKLMAAEKLGAILQEVSTELNMGGGGRCITDILQHCSRLLLRAEEAEENDIIKDVIEKIEHVQDDLAEIMQNIEQIGYEYNYDPNQLETTEERLFALRAAARKHKVTTDELPELLHNIASKLENIELQEDTIAKLKIDTENLQQQYLQQAQIISEKRKHAADMLVEAVLNELKYLKMGAAKFRIAHEKLPVEQSNAYGMDKITFEVSTNSGNKFVPLHKTASGGEMSRLMLALKVVLARDKYDNTLIFDEIDSGTSGAVADAIGERLSILGNKQQVIAITHLPQIASKGTTHIKVSKHQKQKETSIQVQLLNKHERREELAQMISGSTITDEARQAATKLLEAM